MNQFHKQTLQRRDTSMTQVEEKDDRRVVVDLLVKKRTLVLVRTMKDIEGSMDYGTVQNISHLRGVCNQFSSNAFIKLKSDCLHKPNLLTLLC